MIKEKLLLLGFKENDFLIGYEPTSEETKFFKLILHATKDKYDKLIGDNFRKSIWTANEIKILSYWRK